MAAAAAPKVRTGWFCPVRRSRKNRFGSAASKTALLLNQRRFDSLSFEHKRYKDGFARTQLIRRQACESVATVNEFFNRKLQVWILCAGKNAEQKSFYM